MNENLVSSIYNLPADFAKHSFDDKNFKVNQGESLHKVDTRLKSFIDDLLKCNYQQTAVVVHGIILLSYLQTICTDLAFDGKKFKIKYYDHLVLNGTPKNPSIYHIDFDDKKNIIDVQQIEM